MNIFISALVAILCFFVSFVCLDESRTNRIILIRQVNPEENYESKKIGSIWILILSFLAMAAAFFAALKLQTNIFDSINLLKMLIALVCMTGAACVDFREHRIPNAFPAMMALSGMILLTIGFVNGQEGAVSYVISSLFAAFTVSVLLIGALLLSKNGIGGGDIKLLASLGLLCGVYTVGATVFIGMVLCVIAAVIALILKKKTMKGSFPFGPFLYIGYLTSIFISMY